MKFFFGLFFVVLSLSSAVASGMRGVSDSQVRAALGDFARRIFVDHRDEVQSRIRISSVSVCAGSVDIHFNDHITHLSIREGLLESWRTEVGGILARRFRVDMSDVQVRFYAKGRPLEDYIPNVYRVNVLLDSSYYAGVVGGVGDFLVDVSRPDFSDGLSGCNIALWASHGYFYESRDSVPSWQFQRPALFRTVEDLNTYEYLYRYLSPMLEGAGGRLFVPRERCVQPREVIVDSDWSSRGSSVRVVRGLWSGLLGGYSHIDTLLVENPHTSGLYMHSSCDAVIQFRGFIPESGRYGVSISYPSFADNQHSVQVRVHHSGGVSQFILNQQVMGSVWVYLGEWHFGEGDALVEFVGERGGGRIVADVVRFGGGMGSVSRGGGVSGMPRWTEAARYYLQYSGVPDSVYRVGEYELLADVERDLSAPVEQDYVDDYKCRGEWVNWLVRDKGVDVDLSLALHTNSGVVDSIFGSLAIHTTSFNEVDTLWDGSSRMTNRELSDIVLSEVVDVMRQHVHPQWTKRTNYDKLYSETARPIVPSMILEMFSHQNHKDMELAMTPTARFWMARGVYVGLLKYLAGRSQRRYIVQPLPPREVRIEGGQLLWAEWVDCRERTSGADGFVVYGSFNGVDYFEVGRTKSTYLDVSGSRALSFYVVGYNGGGYSLRSFVVGRSGVVVDDSWVDLSYTGEVYDWDSVSEFVDNSNPGYGASGLECSGVGRRVVFGK